jgi:hypothetical protein
VSAPRRPGRRAARSGTFPRMMMRSYSKYLVLAAVVPAAFFIAGCDKTVDTGELQSKIAENIKTQVGQKVTVKCPDDIKAKAGNKVNCTVTLANGTKVKAVVTMKDDNGNFSYTVAQ